MDSNLSEVVKMQIERTVTALNRNNFDARFVSDRAELLRVINELAPSGLSAACGGSVTLDETGVLPYIYEHYHFFDRYKAGLSNAERHQVYVDSMGADVYFTSANAITESGELYNVDGNSNRVAALVFGPKIVIVIAGYNKIVKDLQTAQRRVREVSAPANSRRLGLDKNGCYHTGHCTDCRSDTRVCRNYVITGFQKPERRIKVLILPEVLGY